VAQLPKTKQQSPIFVETFIATFVGCFENSHPPQRIRQSLRQRAPGRKLFLKLRHFLLESSRDKGDGDIVQRRSENGASSLETTGNLKEFTLPMLVIRNQVLEP